MPFNLICCLLLLLMSGLAFPAAAQTGSWTAEYYDNVELTGNPVVVRSEIRPRGNWGEGSPHRGIPANFFAARWTTRVWLEEDTYQLSAQADDGIRVLVDDVAVIDEWRATGADLFQLELPLETGEHKIVVEYLEQEGRAQVIFNMDPLLTPPPEDAPRARITARFLNMRNDSGMHGDVVKLVTMNQVLPVVDRNGLGTWLELEFGDLRAWVNASYVEAENLDNVQTSDGSPVPVSEVSAVVTTATLNLRDLPDLTGRILLRIREGERYPVLGRNLDEDWLWLNVNGVNGWAHNDWLDAQPGLETVPVLNEDAVLSDATITADYLNVRTEPSLEGRILHIVTQGQIYAVIGRNADASWVQLNTEGIAGWVSSAWVNVLPDLDAVAVIDDSRETPLEEEEGGDNANEGDPLPAAQTPVPQDVTPEATAAST
ncbi:MAG: SH3 domain-containing protein [Anaerolineae bacterium]|nr:SH3 domain-containing protein [Anaerolineae bacterium]